MTTLVPVNSSARFRTVGFTLVEVLVAIAIMGIVFVTLYTGIANGFCSIGWRYPKFCVWVGFIVTVSPSPQAGR